MSVVNMLPSGGSFKTVAYSLVNKGNYGDESGSVIDTENNRTKTIVYSIGGQNESGYSGGAGYLQGSNNNSTWTDLITCSYGSGKVNFSAGTTSQTYRYYRVQLHHAHGQDRGCALAFVSAVE